MKYSRGRIVLSGWPRFLTLSLLWVIILMYSSGISLTANVKILGCKGNSIGLGVPLCLVWLERLVQCWPSLLLGGHDFEISALTLPQRSRLEATPTF
ncbi:hypothetical protein J6590_100218 [Homalodisca vitripennis]|nr:hypothetical protein J6590_100218 [Homalodisca vitripennis]